ncbi:MAG: hypothetical protein KBI12_03470 [Methanothrix sp.]|nr:hypothetical protein [Methanothrix sp.]HQI67682.1 hypothetical protein [Methanothrix sp.]HRT16842.1 hypothetical protein [Methanothrix sp.]
MISRYIKVMPENQGEKKFITQPNINKKLLFFNNKRITAPFFTGGDMCDYNERCEPPAAMIFG